MGGPTKGRPEFWMEVLIWFGINRIFNYFLGTVNPSWPNQFVEKETKHQKVHYPVIPKARMKFK